MITPAKLKAALIGIPSVANNTGILVVVEREDGTELVGLNLMRIEINEGLVTLVAS
jgi:hypothetical protein